MDWQEVGVNWRDWKEWRDWQGVDVKLSDWQGTKVDCRRERDQRRRGSSASCKDRRSEPQQPWQIYEEDGCEEEKDKVCDPEREFIGYVIPGIRVDWLAIPCRRRENWGYGFFCFWYAKSEGSMGCAVDAFASYLEARYAGNAQVFESAPRASYNETATLVDDECAS